MLTPGSSLRMGVPRKQYLVKALQLAMKAYYRDGRYQSVPDYPAKRCINMPCRTELLLLDARYEKRSFRLPPK